MKRLRVPEEAMKWFRLMGALGGKARARKYSKAQLRAWGKLGGRPRKQKGGEQ